MLVNDLGYVEKLSVRGAPYDFRKGPSMYKKKREKREEVS